MLRTTRRTACVAGTLLATLWFVPSVSAQSVTPGPTTTERAITLASPGVVFIDTSVKIHVRLIYRNQNTVSGLGHLDRSYRFDYATGSGFVVTPTGVVVTASHVVEPEPQSMRNYAANRLVLEGFGYTYPNRNSSPFDQYTLPVGWQNVLLQQCYKAVACRFNVRPIETVYSPVDIAQTQLPKGSPARVLTSTGFRNTDVAVLQVNGSNMPTVPLGDTATSLTAGDEVVALGFPGTSRDALQTGVTQPNKVFGRVSNIRPQGTSNLIEIDANIEPGMSGGPVIDASGDVVGLISFSLVQASGESGAKYLRTIDDIKAALAEAGVTPSRGPVDDAFASAMDLFWGNHFSAAVPGLQKTVDLYPGHPLGTEYLTKAQSKAGTSSDVAVPTPSPSGAKGGSGFPMWGIGVIAGLVALGVVGLLLARRRKGPAPAPMTTAPIVAPVAPVAPPAGGVEVSGVAGRAMGSQPQIEPPAPNGEVAAPSASPAGTTTSVASRFCSSCGQGLEREARFCPACGHRASG